MKNLIIFVIIVLLPLVISAQIQLTETNCSNGIDDDGDGLIDCFDPDCIGNPDCALLNNGSPQNGVAEGTGSFFEITNSDYLNVTLASSTDINIFMSSVPQMISMNISKPEATTVPYDVTITITGLLPLTVYFKYEDSYHNLDSITTDANGNYTWTQNLNESHHVWIQPTRSTIFICDDATGCGCTTIGTWNPLTRTCTLTTDVTETIQIDSPNITLDGNNHSITGSGTGYGIYIYNKTNVTIKNCVVSNFTGGIYISSSTNNNLFQNSFNSNYYGISGYASSFNNIAGNTVSLNSSYGIHFNQSSNNNLTNNVTNSNSYGIYLQAGSGSNTVNGNTTNLNTIGIYISNNSDNIITGNIATGNSYSGFIIPASSNNVINSNNVSGNNGFGMVISSGSSNSITNNIASNNLYSGIQLSGGSTNSISENTISNNNTYGIRLDNVTNSNITNNTAESNNMGFCLYYNSDNSFMNNNISGNTEYGIFLQTCQNNTIGGIGTQQSNTITNNGTSGIYLISSNSILISGNRIYDNPLAIQNSPKAAPLISSFDGTTITGTSEPNDIIEIFGSTGNENANEYLATVTADANGDWTTNVNTTYGGVVATATEIMNTSQFSLFYQYQRPLTQLIPNDCYATGVTFDQTLTATSISGVDEYEFNVRNENNTFIRNVVKNTRSFQLNEISSNLSYLTNYFIKVRTIIGSDTSDWGNECIIKTTFDPLSLEFPGLSLNRHVTDSITGETYIPPMYVYDRFGDSTLLENIRIRQNSHIAGIFRLHFFDEDCNGGLGNGKGFDDGDPSTQTGFATIGEERRALLIRMFEDLSMLVCPAGQIPNPYPIEFNGGSNCPTHEEVFPNCRYVEIDVRESDMLPYNAAGAASQWYLDVKNGPVHGEVWKYINTGYDPYKNLANPGFPVSPYYHGYVSFNFQTPTHIGYTYNYNPTATSIPGKLDFYTISLHEASHILGFASKINAGGTGSNGVSLENGTNPGRFSAYDTYLFLGSTPLITNSSGNAFDLDNNCYDTWYNQTIPLNNLNNACSLTNINFSGTFPLQTMYSSAGYNPASSFSHVNCSNTAGYVMNSGISPGYFQRSYNETEVQILCALGYDITGILGTGVNWIGIPMPQVNYVNGCPSTLRHVVAGTNDFGIYSDPPVSIFSVQAGDPIVIDNVINNDNNATSICCVDIVIGDGTILTVVPGATSFTYQTGGTFTGEAVIRYRPVNNDGQRGNITYVFIRVTAPQLPVCTCTSQCNENLICYGGFEEFLDQNHMRNILTFNTSGQSFFFDGSTQDNTPDFNVPHLQSFLNCNNTTIMPIVAHTGSDFIRLVTRTDNIGNNRPEGIALSLACPVPPGAEGDITFFALTGSCNDLFIDARLTNIAPCPGLVLSACPSLVQTVVYNSAFIIPCNSSSNCPWNQYTIHFTNNTNENMNFLLINSNTNGIHNSSSAGQNTVSFIYLDDISLIVDEFPIQITSIVSNSAPCQGDNFSIIYNICTSGNIPAWPITLSYHDQFNSLPSGLTINQGTGSPSFDPATGLVTIMPNEWDINGCIVVTIDFTVNGNAIPGTTINHILNILSGACVSGMPVNDIINIGLNNALSINKSVSIAGTTATFTIDITNNTNFDISNIMIEDVIPAGQLTFLSSIDFVQSSPNHLELSSPLTLLHSNPHITLEFTASVVANCILIENCAAITSAANVCGLPIEDCTSFMLNSAPTSVSFTPPSCIGSDVPEQFFGFGDNVTTWSWDFGDGTTSNLQNPVHQFSDFGYHCVVLTAGNDCGNTSFTLPEPPFVMPEKCMCDASDGGNIHYYYPNGITIPSNSSVTWNTFTPGFTSGHCFINGDVVIKPNAVLIIDGVYVHFSPKGRVIVEQGAGSLPAGQLALVNNAYLTNLGDVCTPAMWQGVEALGNTNYASTSPLQSIVKITDSQINNAHIAILLGKRNLSNICNFAMSDPPPYPFETNYSGGVIKSQYSIYEANGVDFKFIKKVNTDGIANLIYKNQFLCGDFSFIPLIDGHYNSSHSNPYPNSHNPWAGNTWQYMYGGGAGNTYTASHEGIELHNIRKVKIDNNVFKFKEYSIRSVDAQYYVTKNTFKNTQYGVYIINSMQNLSLAHDIKDNTFEDIAGVPNLDGKAIYIIKGISDRITHNSFNNSSSIANNCKYGIYLDFSSKYSIQENNFNFYKIGISVYVNKTGYIGAGGPYYVGNQFRDCPVAIETYFDNKQVKLQCNDHTPNFGNYSGNNWVNYGLTIGINTYTLGDQGIDSQIPKKLAGNSFIDITRKHIYSNKTYKYFHHGTTSIFNIYRPNLSTGSLVQINTPSGGFVNYGSNITSCSNLTIVEPPDHFINFNEYPYSELAVQKDFIEQLNVNLNTLIENLDRGQTTFLLETIENSILTQGELKNLLISNSPLSDGVILTVLEKQSFSPGNFKLVMQENLPVSQAIEEEFFIYVESLPNGIKNQLLALQNYNSNATTPTTIQRQIDIRLMEYSTLINDIISALLNDTTANRKDEILILLEWDGSLNSKQILLDNYLADGNYSNAVQKLSEIHQSNDFMAQDYEVYDILLPLYSQGNDLFSLSETELNIIREIAFNCPPNPAVYTARSIVEILLGEVIPECSFDLQSRTSRYNKNSENDYCFLGENYPEPFKDFTIIPYSISGESKYSILIFDIMGRKVYEDVLIPSNKEIKVDTDEWQEGVYYYTLSENGKYICTKKMILIK